MRRRALILALAIVMVVLLGFQLTGQPVAQITGQQLCTDESIQDLKNRIQKLETGASVIKCCYAANLCSLNLPASNITSMKTTTKRIFLGSATNIFLKLSRLETNPACMAGVRTSHPNFRAL